MSENDDIRPGDGDSGLVAEYVLGLLEGEERARIEARLAREPVLAREAEAWRRRLSELDAHFAEVDAPRGALAEIEARLFGKPARRSPLAAIWDNLVLWRSLAAAGVAVAIIALGITVMRPQPLSPRDFARQLVAAIGETGGSVRFLALYDPSSGTVRLTGVSGTHAANKDFELWMIKGDAAPVSMGVLPAGAQSVVHLPKDMSQNFTAGTVLAITLEQKGGSPTGAPQGPLVAKGTATAI